MTPRALFGGNGGTGHKGNLSLSALLEPSANVRPFAATCNMEELAVDAVWTGLLVASSGPFGPFVTVCFVCTSVWNLGNLQLVQKWTIGCQLENLQSREQLSPTSNFQASVFVPRVALQDRTFRADKKRLGPPSWRGLRPLQPRRPQPNRSAPRCFLKALLLAGLFRRSDRGVNPGMLSSSLPLRAHRCNSRT